MFCFTPYIGHPAQLYDQANPDWAPSVKMGHDWTARVGNKRHERVEKRQAKRETSVGIAASALLDLKRPRLLSTVTTEETAKDQGEDVQ